MGAECLARSSFCLSPLCEEDINAMEMEDDKRDLISREISKFRDTHKVMYHNAAVTLHFCFREGKKINFLNKNNPLLS